MSTWTFGYPVPVSNETAKSTSLAISHTSPTHEKQRWNAPLWLSTKHRTVYSRQMTDVWNWNLSPYLLQFPTVREEFVDIDRYTRMYAWVWHRHTQPPATHGLFQSNYIYMEYFQSLEKKDRLIYTSMIISLQIWSHPNSWIQTLTVI